MQNIYLCFNNRINVMISLVSSMSSDNPRVMLDIQNVLAVVCCELGIEGYKFRKAIVVGGWSAWAESVVLVTFYSIERFTRTQCLST